MSYDANSLNLVTLVGRLGADPELGQTKDNKVSFARINIGTKKAWKDKDKKRQEQTTWVPILFWRKQAELCGQLLKKGSLVAVTGSLEKQSWQEDEVHRSRLYVLGQTFTPLGAKPKPEETESQEDESSEVPIPVELDDDIPLN